ncbi:MAG: hypothetical protein IPO36_05310, partial [Anaerolineales bacterium]|nr:hypothetical protein [Anaerolineales bacterium]
LFHRPKKKGKTSTNVLYLVGEWRVLEKKIYDTDSYSDDNGKMVSIPSSNPYVSETYGFVTDFRVSISVCEECIRFERRNNSSSKDVIARHLAEPMIKVFFPNHEYLEENAVRTRIEHTKY